MKGKVIYVDFESRARKVTCEEQSKGKNILKCLTETIRKAFNKEEEPDKLKKEVYNFKRMM